MVDNIYSGQFTWELLEEFLTELAKESTKTHKTIYYLYYKENDEYWKEKRLSR